MQNPLPTGQKLLPAAPEAQIAFIKKHPGLNEIDKSVLAMLVETRQSNKEIVATNTRIKALNTKADQEAVSALEAPMALADLQTPRLAFAKLAYRTLFWVTGLQRETTEEWQREDARDFAQKIDTNHAAFERFFDASDRILFEIGQDKFSPTGKQIWNELADITRRESHPRYSATEIARTPAAAHTSAKSLGHS